MISEYFTRRSQTHKDMMEVVFKPTKGYSPIYPNDENLSHTEAKLKFKKDELKRLSTLPGR